MKFNFMNYYDEDEAQAEKNLKLALESVLPIGKATVQDVLDFCDVNGLERSEPQRLHADNQMHSKYELVILSRARAPSGKKEFFRLSNWLNILRHPEMIFAAFFWYTFWGLRFYFNDNRLSEIQVEGYAITF
jgi:hypothetical protein